LEPFKRGGAAALGLAALPPVREWAGVTEVTDAEMAAALAALRSGADTGLPGLRASAPRLLGSGAFASVYGAACGDAGEALALKVRAVERGPGSGAGQGVN